MNTKTSTINHIIIAFVNKTCLDNIVPEPVAERTDPNEHVWGAAGAGEAPRDHTNLLTPVDPDQSTAGVTLEGERKIKRQNVPI